MTDRLMVIDTLMVNDFFIVTFGTSQPVNRLAPMDGQSFYQLFDYASLKFMTVQFGFRPNPCNIRRIFATSRNLKYFYLAKLYNE